MFSQKIIKSYMPMSETAYYILLSLTEPRHGYGIMQYVEELTEKRINLGPGTLYGSLSKMEKDRLIRFITEENKRKIYEITSFGFEILQSEIKRITELYLHAMQVLKVDLKEIVQLNQVKREVLEND